MESIKGIHINQSPFGILRKISDLISFEGPILSHFQDDKQNDFLFYWVDYEQSFNKWLVFEVKKEYIYSYLNQTISLNDLMLKHSTKFSFLIDIDKDCKYHNILMTTFEDLPKSYIPEPDLLFNYEIPECYTKLITIHKDDFYLQALKEKALYLKIEPIDKKHGNTVSAEDAIEFIKTVVSSYKSYVKYNFFQAFKNKFPSSEKLNNAIDRIIKQLSPRVIEAGYSSFMIGLSSDYIMDKSDSEFNEWKKNAITNYRDEVILPDYNSNAVIEAITKKYEPEERKNIFQPIIKTINNSKYSLSHLSGNIKSTPIRIKTVKKETEIKITEIPKILTQELPEEKRLVNIVVEIDKNDDLSNISKKNLQLGLLFSEEITNTIFRANKIETEKYTFVFKMQIEFSIKQEKNNYIVIYEPLNIKVEGRTKEEYLPAFYKAFQNLYEKSVINKDKTTTEYFVVFEKIIKTASPKEQ